MGTLPDIAPLSQEETVPNVSGLRYTLRMSKPLLSKSRFVKGLQCEKALYLTVHSPKLATPVSAATQARFDQGREVESVAHKRWPDGVLITAQYFETELAVQQTRDAIAGGALTIFEATFLFEGIQVKVDVLHRSRAEVGSEWEVFEIKSSTGVKDVYIQDAAVQLFVLLGSGLTVSRVSVLHINSACVYPRLEDLFTAADVTDEVMALLPGIPARLAGFQTMLAGGAVPSVAIGPHCADPYGCDFKDHCWAAAGVPALSVFDIPGLGVRAWDLYRAGVIALKDISATDFKLNALQKRMVAVSLSGERFMDVKKIARELREWQFPLISFDFETIMYAIPRYDGCRPYQQLPFQFSCHVLTAGPSGDGTDGALSHFEYLHVQDTDPRRAIAEAIVGAVPTSGSVVAYNKGFEGRVLRELASEFADLRSALLGVAARLVDPWPLIKSAVYDVGFAGSFSLKDVGPALLGDGASYADLSVGDGQQAQAAYVEMIGLTPGDSNAGVASRFKELRDSLLKYCRQDTLVVLDLVKWLQTCVAYSK